MTFKQWKKMPHPDWKTAPISPVCETQIQNKPPVFCNKTTIKVYPAMGAGWAALCYDCGKQHTEAFDVYEVIASGEKWE